jgi:retron-type reverse transcriptase
MKAVRSHIGEGWILLYIERWLTAPFETTDGERLPRERGTPQGGLVGPILMNLFMHYTFDAWMTRTNPSCPFARYADDAVVHCRTREQAEEVMRSIASRLRAKMTFRASDGTRLADGENALENRQSDNIADCYIPQMEQLHQPPMTKSA